MAVEQRQGCEYPYRQSGLPGGVKDAEKQSSERGVLGMRFWADDKYRMVERGDRYGRRGAWLCLYWDFHPSWLNLVPRLVVDVAEGGADVVGDGLLGGEGVLAGVDGDLPVAAQGLDEPADGPAGEVLDTRRGRSCPPAVSRGNSSRADRRRRRLQIRQRASPHSHRCRPAPRLGGGRAPAGTALLSTKSGGCAGLAGLALGFRGGHQRGR
jgi:hypothetical protein